MKRLVSLLCVIPLLFCSACQSEDDQLYNRLVAERVAQLPPSPEPEEWLYLNRTPEPGDTLKGEITVRGFWQNSWDADIECLAREFMARHPAVKINIQWDLGFYDRRELTLEEREAREEAFINRLRMEMAVGIANYLYFDCEGSSLSLNVTSLSRSGILEDFGPYLRDTPEFGEDTFYNQVLEAFQVEGRQTMLPNSFSYTSICFDREVLESIGVDPESITSVSTTQVMEWYERAREQNPELGLFFNSPEVDQMFPLERTAYIDLEERSSSFDDPAFADYLESLLTIQNEEPDMVPEYVGRWSSPGLAIESLRYQNEGRYSPFYDNFEEDPILITRAKPFFAVLHTAEPSTLLTAYQPLEYLAGPYPLVNSQGELGVMSYDAFFMPSCMQNKDLAWEFIQYCISDREEPRLEEAGYPWYYTNYFPVNRHNMGAMAQDASDGTGFSLVDDGFVTGIWQMDVNEYLTMVETIVSYPLVPIDFYNVDTQEFLDEFYVNRLTTPEECAEKIQGRATIWLNE